MVNDKDVFNFLLIFIPIFIFIIFYLVYKDTKSIEYKKGYSDYPNDEIYKMCESSNNITIVRYKNGLETAKYNDEMKKEKETIDKILN